MQYCGESKGFHILPTQKKKNRSRQILRNGERKKYPYIYFENIKNTFIATHICSLILTSLLIHASLFFLCISDTNKHDYRPCGSGCMVDWDSRSLFRLAAPTIDGPGVLAKVCVCVCVCVYVCVKRFASLSIVYLNEYMVCARDIILHIFKG